MAAYTEPVPPVRLSFRRYWWLWAGVAALVVGSFVLGLLSAAATEAAPIPQPSRALPTASSTPMPVHFTVRSCSVAELAADPRLGELHAQVRRADSGEVLFDRAGTVPARAASAQKVIVAAAALG